MASENFNIVTDIESSSEILILIFNLISIPRKCKIVYENHTYLF